MPLTVLDASAPAGEVEVEADLAEGRAWIPASELERVSGWTRKPEGLCRGDVCVPVRGPIEDGDRIDLVGVASALGRRAVLEPAGPVLAVADDPMGRGEPRNLHDLSLPDVDGRMIDLSTTAGKKVVVHAWASW